MPQTVTEASTVNSPLAPSVEKAYYRKCIELKRRLNEVEAANDEARIRRVRLDRAIMKMRLERAFLLEQLSKRMEADVDGSEASADEHISTVSVPKLMHAGVRDIITHREGISDAAQPPPDRPHRDKKRRQTGTAASASKQAAASSNARAESPAMSPAPPPNDTSTAERGSRARQSHRQHDDEASGHVNGADEDLNDQRMDIDKEAGVVGDAVTTGPAIRRDDHDQRRVVPDGAEEPGLNAME